MGGPERADGVREGVRLSGVVELLRELIRADTVNPPGNETRAAEILRAYLEDSGVEVELFAKVPERANLVARIRGNGSGPTFALLSHTDTVLADPAEWQRDPWSGEIVDGEIWGRGALDMKGQVAASAVAIASLAREGNLAVVDWLPELARHIVEEELAGDENGLRGALRREWSGAS